MEKRNVRNWICEVAALGVAAICGAVICVGAICSRAGGATAAGAFESTGYAESGADGARCATCASHGFAYNSQSDGVEAV
jgi:hypothetical protein